MPRLFPFFVFLFLLVADGSAAEIEKKSLAAFPIHIDGFPAPEMAIYEEGKEVSNFELVKVIRNYKNQGHTREEARQMTAEYLRERVEPDLLFAMWEDGLVVWKDQTISSETVFLSAFVKKRAVHQALTQVQHFAASHSGSGVVLPHSAYITITWKESSGKYSSISSAHPLAEKNSELVLLSTGLHNTNGKSRKEMIEEDIGPFRPFREAWEKITGVASDLITSAPPDRFVQDIDVWHHE